MKQRFFLLLWAALLACLGTATAQSDYTSKITNPSFEKDAEGWTSKSMSAQSNNVFDIKAGTKYMEKWTGRGGQVGDGFLRQEISDLPPGNYELTAAAQNIQEDTPKAAQKGACIFAGEAKTTVTVRDTYKVAFNFVSGSILIGFEAVGATGNWIAVDNFRLTQVGTDLTAELTAAIQRVEDEYGAATGKESQQLLDAIAAAKHLVMQSEHQPTAEEQAEAIIAMEHAVEVYRCANASAENPLDLTDRIQNPSFENGLEGWTQTGMGVQGNNVFSIKQGNNYVERWTGRGGAVGDGKVAQRLTGMMPGRYRLKATAQNIQEDSPKTAQTGAWIFANNSRETVTVRGEYVLEFTLVADEVEIGFEAQGATGNWIACDNFRLEYIGEDVAEAISSLSDLIERSQALLKNRMNSTAKQQLEAAIQTASTCLQQLIASGAAHVDTATAAATTELESAYNTAQTSIAVFARLQAAITAAQEELSASDAQQKADYQTAIAAAQAVYDNAATTDAQAEAAIAPLGEASFAFRIANGGTGEVPKVTTDPRFIRGCVWAFGRSTVSGKNLLEEGFCWSEDPAPKVTDHRTTEYLNQAGKIYWLRDLKPATIYYMRAYAITKDYTVGYGDVIKFSTLPKGQVGHWYNNGGDEETNDRINYAINTAMDHYWNNLTSIHGFGISVTYSPGTPTADCGYGGGMRVGASSSYQQPGTIMHEALHGIGVGTHGMWWNGEMRSGGNRGDWLGDRVTEAVRFWDNSATAVITGDDMHLWPYGCNGAHEDSHSDNLYLMMGILAQALNEDGLPGSGEISYALPYYAFTHEDGVKYYIKNEDEKRGLRTSYLAETATHQLQWKTMDAEEAMADDAAAWYLSFNPKNQYYQLKNAATGYYMTYSSGFKTANHTKPTAADDLHLMRGRVEVEGHRGYYIIHPESNANPPTLQANTAGKTASAAWNIAKSATTQRWLILTAEEATNLDNGNLDLAREELDKLLAQVRKLAKTPHSETAEGTDDQLDAQLTAIEASAKTCTKGKEVTALTEQLRSDAMNFLSNVAATDMEQPFDLTFLLENPDFDNDATTGWTTADAPGYGGKGAEFYERTFNFYQTLDNMPSGVYQLMVQAFQRPGEASAVYKQYTAGKKNISSSIYLNNKTEPIKNICDDSQKKALHSEDKQLATGVYVPNVMNGAAAYFAKGLYDNSVALDLETAGASLKVGIKGTKTASYYWTMFDHFRLYFYGGNKTLTGVEGLLSDSHRGGEGEKGTAVYDLSGRRQDGKNLKPGMYIVGGKKIVVK